MAGSTCAALPRWRGGVALAVIGLMPFSSQAAAPTTEELLQKLDALAARVKKLEQDKAALEQALSKQYISADEPQLAARVKAVEAQSMSYKKAAKTIEKLEGIEASVGLTMVGQSLLGAIPHGQRDAELNYRADATVSLPAGEFGNASGFIFAHFRMGQGLGLENPLSAFSSVNSTSFQRPGSAASDSTVLLAQAWYQLNVPLPFGGIPDASDSHLEFNIGKMDPFMFFDQNKVADDETRGFINQSFVHNPLLDTDGDVGVDEFGFSPGLRIAYVNDADAPLGYGVSLGVFGAGTGASFNDSFDSPFVIVQADTHQRLFDGLDGNYRAYFWHNSQAMNYDGTVHDHSGVGLSIDQRVGDYINLFGRYGLHTQGQVRFDQALTLGAEFGGSYWNRGADAIGVALGWLGTSDEFRRDSLTVDADGDGNPDYGYRADKSEQITELYYRYHFNDQLALSPNLQLIRNPGGNGQGANVKTFGVRAQIDF